MNSKFVVMAMGLFFAPFAIDQWQKLHEMLAPPPVVEPEPSLYPQFPTRNVKLRIRNERVLIDYPKPGRTACPDRAGGLLKLTARNILSKDYTLTMKPSGPDRWTSETDHSITFDVVQHSGHVELRVQYGSGVMGSSDQPEQFEYLGSDAEAGRIYAKTVTANLCRAVTFTPRSRLNSAVSPGH